MYDPVINSQNDDDIFDDNKSLNDLDSSVNSNDRKKKSDLINDTFQGSFSQDTNENQRTERFLKLFGSEGEKFLGNIRYKITVGFYESVARWLFEYKVDDVSFGTYSYLSSLGNGDYPLYHRYYELEMQILKKHIVCSFLEDTFLNKEAFKSFNELNKFFKSNIDEGYINTYFQSMYDMLQFTLIQEIGFYKALAKELNLEMLDSVTEGTGSVNEVAGFLRRNTLLSSKLTVDLRKSIADFINKEMEQNGF